MFLPAGLGVCHLSHSDRHHRGLQGGSAGLPRQPPAGVLPEPLLPLRHREVSSSPSEAGRTGVDWTGPVLTPASSSLSPPAPPACREKFWRVGQKERDGEYGACFLPQNRGLVPGQPPLLYCARPGSRMWEANFSGDVLSTHQFKQLLACPPLPLVSYRHRPPLH